MRHLPALGCIAWSFWPLMIMVTSSGRRAPLGRRISLRIHDFIMHLLPIAESQLRFALHRTACRTLGRDPRVISIDQPDPLVTSR